MGPSNRDRITLIGLAVLLQIAFLYSYVAHLNFEPYEFHMIAGAIIIATLLAVVSKDTDSLIRDTVFAVMPMLIIALLTIALLIILRLYHHGFSKSPIAAKELGSYLALGGGAFLVVLWIAIPYVLAIRGLKISVIRLTKYASQKQSRK